MKDAAILLQETKRKEKQDERDVGEVGAGIREGGPWDKEEGEEWMLKQAETTEPLPFSLCG